MKTGEFFLNIICCKVILPKTFWITNLILLSGFKPTYLLEPYIPNKCPNIFMRRKSLQWMSKYIGFGKIHKYLSKWIYSSINIRKYSNIRIFATHCPTLKLVLELLSIDFFNLWKWVFHKVTRHNKKRQIVEQIGGANLVKTFLSVYNFATLMKLSCVKTA